MKKIFYITLIALVLPVINVYAQKSINYDFYIGTWRYVNTKTNEELTIKFRETTHQVPPIFGGHIEECLAGVYIHTKNGQIILDNSDQFMSNIEAMKMPIYAAGDTPFPDTLFISVADYGRLWKGQPKGGGGRLIIESNNPKKIRWQIKGYERLWINEEGHAAGFSIPTDAVFTKVEENENDRSKDKDSKDSKDDKDSKGVR